ncbi:MAG: hypothetical protein O0X96_03205 [Methanocorpusculum sp.]|nr:hypothetical protein [Methanocorpusculum sp.]
MTHTYRPARTRSRRIRKTQLPRSIYLLPDGRIMYLRYNKNPIANSARPYITADDGKNHPAYIPPLPEQIWRKHHVQNPARNRRAYPVQTELAKLLRLPKTCAQPAARTQLAELADWLAVMYRLTETTSASPDRQHTAPQPEPLRSARLLS